MTTKKSKQKRTLVGVVVSDRMMKTVVVRVDRIKKHPKYERRYRVSKRYKASDEKSEFHVGDIVRIEETRPLSRGKRWRVIRRLIPGSIGAEQAIALETSETEST